LSILGGDFENLFRQQDSYFLYFVLCCTCVITSRCNLEVAVEVGIIGGAFEADAIGEQQLKQTQLGSSSRNELSYLYIQCSKGKEQNF